MNMIEIIFLVIGLNVLLFFYVTSLVIILLCNKSCKHMYKLEENEMMNKEFMKKYFKTNEAIATIRDCLGEMAKEINHRTTYVDGSWIRDKECKDCVECFDALIEDMFDLCMGAGSVVVNNGFTLEFDEDGCYYYPDFYDDCEYAGHSEEAIEEKAKELGLVYTEDNIEEVQKFLRQCGKEKPVD